MMWNFLMSTLLCDVVPVCTTEIRHGRRRTCCGSWSRMPA
jgi:hypothetical protein